MKKDHKNQLTLDELLLLADSVNFWRKSNKQYYSDPTASNKNNSIRITTTNDYIFTNNYYNAYSGILKMNNTVLNINVYHKTPSTNYSSYPFNYQYSYGLFVSDKNDPFFIKGDFSDKELIENHTYIPTEHHVSLMESDANHLLIKEIYSRAKKFVDEAEQKKEEKRKQQLYKGYEQKNSERKKKINESTYLLKSYINDLKIL